MAIHFLPGSGADANIVLVDGSDPILVDAGTGENRDRLLAKIRGITKGHGIHRIVLTHRHFDHIGGAGEMSASLGAKLLAHPMDADVLRKGDGWQTISIMYGVPGTALDVVDLREGTKLDTGTHELTVLHTPGHTEGSICLFEKRTGALISGDTVFADGVGRWDFPSGNLDALKRSVGSLMELKVTDLYPGHGPCVKGDGHRSVMGAMKYLGEC